jgi:hypothetical protein
MAITIMAILPTTPAGAPSSRSGRPAATGAWNRGRPLFRGPAVRRPKRPVSEETTRDMYQADVA